jgi:hypothetical protein
VGANSLVAQAAHVRADFDEKSSDEGGDRRRSSSTMAADSTTIDPSSKTAMGTFRCFVLNFISALVKGLTSVRAIGVFV